MTNFSWRVHCSRTPLAERFFVTVLSAHIIQSFQGFAKRFFRLLSVVRRQWYGVQRQPEIVAGTGYGLDAAQVIFTD
jgi:hypothetical protein